MAAGRHGGYRDYDARERELDLDAPGRKDYRHHLGRHRELDADTIRWREPAGRLRDDRHGEALNREFQNRHRHNDHRNHRMSGASDPRRIRLPESLVDREPGELSSGSGSDDFEAPRLQILENGDVPPPSKKRKFSQIVWDRDDGKLSADAAFGGKKALVVPDAVPQPPLLQGRAHVAAQVAESNVSPFSASLVGAMDSGGSPHGMQVNHHTDPRQMEAEELADGNDEYPTTRNISSSRWADGNDAFGGDEEEVIIPRKNRSVSPVELTGKTLHKKAPSPELGEVIGRDSSVGAVSRSSDSAGEHGNDYQDTAVDLDDHMDVDQEVETEDDVADRLTVGETHNGDKRPKTPEPLTQPHRRINMLQACRSVDEFDKLNKINEGTYGVVYRARDKKSGEIVALKKVKMEKEREGFPLTSLREINILLSFHHPSIVGVKEVVMGTGLDSIFMVMEYMEHDLKGAMETMKQPFNESEVKCLMLQLLEGVKYLHDNWVLHRDLKTSNLLFNNRGELKICDFGLSRQYGSPLKPYTQLVVTLWYRAPELLLGAKKYSTAIDMWSLGCIMAELLAKEPLFNGKSEFDQLDKIFQTLGTPNEKIWPGFSKLPGMKVSFVKQPCSRLRQKFPPTSFFGPPTSFLGRPTLSEAGFDLLNKLLTYDPDKRITAAAALKHDWFRQVPLPKSKDFMPTFPSRHEHDRHTRRVLKSPDPLEEQRLRELRGDVGMIGIFG